MKTSAKKIVAFINVSEAYIKQNPAETKLKYALDKVIESLVPVLKQYTTDKEDIEVDHANVDANDTVLFTVDAKGNRIYSFTKDGLKVRDKKVKELFEKEKYEVKHHWVTELPDGFDEELTPYFEGFVIEPKNKKKNGQNSSNQQ